jgi:tRNA threonylcarbamoyladenosine biosynthesis protein TsaE
VSLWRRVRDLDEARAVLAGPGPAGPGPAGPGSELDLRAAAALDEAWSSLGFRELVPGELVRPLDVVLPDLAATRALGARLAGQLRAGDLLVLTGPLGAGKTSLMQGLGAALGVRGQITSPTFVLARTHRGPLPLTHVDAYRLREAGAASLADLDLDLEAALEDGVVVVEWGEGLAEELADARLEVVLSRVDAGDGPDVRTARVRAHGRRWAVLG